MNSIKKNLILINQNDNKAERIIYVDSKDDLCVTIELNTDKLKIKNYSLNYLEGQLYNKNLRIQNNDPIYRYQKRTEDLTEAEKKLLENRTKIIDSIMEKGELSVITIQSRAEVIANACKVNNIAKKTAYKYLRLFLQSGCDNAGLLSERYKCGGKDKDRIGGSKKIGKPNSIVILKKRNGKPVSIEDQGKVLDENDLQVIDASIEQFLSIPNTSIAMAYEKVLETYYSITVDTGNGTKTTILPRHMIPSLQQYRYWVNKLLNRDSNRLINNNIDRIGKKKHDSKNRGLKSTTTYESFYPGFLMEIDSTIPPFHLLNNAKTHLIGKPIIYAIVDAFSKYICAVMVTLDNPSQRSATSVLVNLTSDKVDFYNRFGISVSYQEVINCGLPRYLLADRGEMVGQFSDKLVRYTSICVQNTSSYAGYQKGNVEQAFRLIEKELMGTPGEIKPDFAERGSPDYRKEARLNLHEFTKLVLIAVQKVNRRYMDDFTVTEEMIQDNVRKIPRKIPFDIFKWGTEKFPNIMDFKSREQIIDVFLETGVASVNESGIIFNGRVYECESCNEEDWRTLARTKGAWKIEIRYDYQNMDKIFYIDKNKNYAEPCFLVKTNEVYSGMSFDEIEAENLISNKNRIEYQSELNDIRADHNRRINEIIREAEATYTALNETGKVNIKDSRNQRQIEKESSLKSIEHNSNIFDTKQSDEMDYRPKNDDRTASFLKSRHEKAK